MSAIRAIVAALLLPMLFSITTGLAAQPAAYPEITTRVDPTSGTVGERFDLVISATVPDLANLQVLPLFDTQTSWTAVGDARTQDRPNGNIYTRTFNYTIVPFETGRQPVPKVAFTYTAADGSTSNTVLSEALWVEVNSVLSGNGSASALRDVKPPSALPVPAVIVWTGGIILLALLALLGWWLWRRYFARLKKLIGRGLTPPEMALKQMNALESERLIEHKKIKEFYTRLSDTVREYLMKAYGIQAMDLTSNELLYALDDLAERQPVRHTDNYRKAIARLAEFMDEADLVKFARFVPEASGCRKALQSGRDVVMLTRYRFEPDDENEKNTGRHRSTPPPSSPVHPQPSSRVMPSEVSR